MLGRFHHYATGRGFTMVELIVVIGIVALLAAVIGPRFVGRNSFAARGFFDQATETVRYAQKTSVAWRRQVFVCVTATTITAGLAAACPAPLTNPATGTPLTITAPNGVTLAGGGFSFTAPTPAQAGGQPSTGAQVVIAVNSTDPGDPARQIVIERETGYVHN
jgi:MSHA pilin protein MshC